MKAFFRRSQDPVLVVKSLQTAKHLADIAQERNSKLAGDGKTHRPGLSIPSTRSFSSSIGTGPYLLPKSLVDQYPLYPLVLVQLPMYNEEAHCEVVIERACRMEWPTDRVIIQVRFVCGSEQLLPVHACGVTKTIAQHH